MAGIPHCYFKLNVSCTLLLLSFNDFTLQSWISLNRNIFQDLLIKLSGIVAAKLKPANEVRLLSCYQYYKYVYSSLGAARTAECAILFERCYYKITYT